MLKLEQRLKASVAAVKAMTPVEREAMHKAQRESFARAMASCEHGVADFEECEECRRKAGVE